MTAAPPSRRLGLLALAVVSLLVGLWGGLVRLGWVLPAEAGLVLAHGPLMVAAVLGVVIGLERAVALGQRWEYAAPLAAGLGGLTLVVGLPTALPAGLFTASSVGLVAIFVVIYRRRPEWSSATLAVGAAAWLVGNALWLVGRSVVEVVPWWSAFLVLTIAGERLELAQVLLPLRVRLALVGIAGLVLAGPLVSTLLFVPGVQLAGLGYALLAAWLVRYDVVRRTVRRGGVARFGAVSLLLGYGWLGIAGVVWALGPAGFPGAFWYDAMVHTLFLGFVFSMIFGHAPTIIPAVTGIMVTFERTFYVHVGLLNGSLLVRLLGDLLSSAEVRAWGGLLNVLAILVFAGLTVRASHRPVRPADGPTTGREDAR